MPDAPDSPTASTQTLDDWLERWRHANGWTLVPRPEVQRLVDEIGRLRMLVKFLDRTVEGDWVSFDVGGPFCGRCGDSLYNHACYPGPSCTWTEGETCTVRADGIYAADPGSDTPTRMLCWTHGNVLVEQGGSKLQAL